jgi:restriction system protein
MSHRKQKHLIEPQVAFRLLIAIGVVWLIVQLLSSPGFLEGMEFVVLLLAAVPLTYLIVRHFQRENAHRTLLRKAQTAIEQHLSALVTQRAQLVWNDPYGKPQMAKWNKERDRFITQQIGPLLTPSELQELEREHIAIASRFEGTIAAATLDRPVFREFSDEMTPEGFEIFCAEQLRKAGWSARVTRKGRDQGVDVVAEKGDIRVVIQCKRYARPVGNKSVQEATAAKAHEQANYGVVVTNNTFTTAAKQLASTNGILLLHYSELQNLSNLLTQRL